MEYFAFIVETKWLIKLGGSRKLTTRSLIIERRHKLGLQYYKSIYDFWIEEEPLKHFFTAEATDGHSRNQDWNHRFCPGNQKWQRLRNFGK